MINTRPYILGALFIDALETEGWKIGTGQRLRLQELLRLLPPDADDEALLLALAPLLARSAHEQTVVYEKFNECRRLADALVDVPAAAAEETPAQEPVVQRRKYIPFLIGLLLIAVAIGVWYLSRPSPVDAPASRVLECSVTTEQPIELCPSRLAAADSTLQNNIQKVVLPEPSAVSIPTTLGSYSVQNDSCLVYSAGKTAGLDTVEIQVQLRNGAVTPLRLYLTVVASEEIESSAAPTTNLEEQPVSDLMPLPKNQPFSHSLLELIVIPAPAWQQWLDVNWYLLRWIPFALLAFLLWRCWIFLEKKRGKVIAELQNRKKPPYVWNIRIPGNDQVDHGIHFQPLLQVMRRRAGANAYHLDIKATIAATAERGGMPQFRYREQTRPVDYLFLIDRQLANNHRAKLYDSLYQALRKQELEAARFFFDADPRSCYNEDHPYGIRLSEIAQRWHEARLIIIGSGTQLISPVSGRLEKWTDLLHSWKESVLLSTKTPGEWGRNERRLGELFNAVLPESFQSLIFWAEEMEDAEDARFGDWHSRINDVQDTFWQPDEEKPIPLLQLQFEPEMLRWIAACAIYPTLHWDLTLWLGKRCAQEAHAQGRDGIVPGADALRKLCRLRWFVDGSIPGVSRTALLEWFQTNDPAFLTRLRLEIAQLLRQNNPPEDSAAWVDHQMTVAITEWMATKDPRRKKELEKQIAQFLEAGAEADFVALKYLDRPRSPLDFEVPKNWKKFLHPAGKPAFGNRLPWLAGLGLVFLGLCALTDRQVQKALDRLVDRCGGQSIVWEPASDGLGSDKSAQQSLLLCLNSRNDTLIWRESQMLEAIRSKNYPLEDSLFRLVALQMGYQIDSSGWLRGRDGSITGEDSLLFQEVRRNLAAAYWNQALAQAPGCSIFKECPGDSACRLCTRAVQRSSLDEDIRHQFWFCAAASDNPAIEFHTIDNIQVSIVDETGRHLPGSKIIPYNLSESAVKGTNGQFTLNLPAAWEQPTLSLIAKAPGRLDSLLTVKLDNAKELKPIQLRKVPAGYSTVTGRIIDESSQSPLQGVLIRIADLGSTFSDRQGQFQVQIPPGASVNTRRFLVDFQKRGFLSAAGMFVAGKPGKIQEGLFATPVYKEYTVKPTDTPESICRNNRISLDELMLINQLNEPGSITAGKTLLLVDETATAKAGNRKGIVRMQRWKSGFTRMDQSTREHVVLGRETVVSIAGKYGVAPNILADLNGISSQDRLTVGQRIMIPSTTAPLSTFKQPELIEVRGGRFLFGNAEAVTEAEKDELPAHYVDLSDFKLGKYEVTNEEYAAFLHENGNRDAAGRTLINLEGSYLDEKCRIRFDGSTYYPEIGYERHPVLYVSWYGAVAYCEWLSKKTGQSFHLPTEAQWEYAARGGSQALVTKFAGANNINEVAWYQDNTHFKGAQPVGKLKPNELGLYDMSGNVWEWCADWYGAYSAGDQINPKGPDKGANRVLRGGSWFNYPQDCRVTDRNFSSPGFHFYNLGFRVSKDESGKKRN